MDFGEYELIHRFEGDELILKFKGGCDIYEIRERVKTFLIGAGYSAELVTEVLGYNDGE